MSMKNGVWVWRCWVWVWAGGVSMRMGFIVLDVSESESWVWEGGTSLTVSYLEIPLSLVRFSLSMWRKRTTLNPPKSWLPQWQLETSRSLDTMEATAFQSIAVIVVSRRESEPLSWQSWHGLDSDIIDFLAVEDTRAWSKKLQVR